MLITDVLIYGAAAAAARHIFRNGSIFGPLRARLEAGEFGRFLRELAGCDLCLATQLAFWLVLLFWVPSRFMSPLVADIWQLVPFALCVTQTALVTTWLFSEFEDALTPDLAVGRIGPDDEDEDEDADIA
jgi:hypothetical protein